MATTIRLLSLNIWDLPVTLPGTERRKRLPSLLDRLPGERADIILFQEAFRPAFRREVLARLPGFHADPFLDARRWVGPLPMDTSGGLATYSRWPITHSEYVPARYVAGMKPDEQIGRKGWLWTTIATPAGPLHVANVHLYAGNSPRDARMRSIQTRHLIRTLKVDAPAILGGDFNMSVGHEHPAKGPTGFELCKAAGLREVADSRTEGLATMSAVKNKWARYAPWHKPDRRLTQIYLHGPLTVVTPPRLCLHQPPVSDHFGLVVDLTVGR